MADLYEQMLDERYGQSLTKEQKVAKRALLYIDRAASENSKRMRECCLNYAMGLLESLLMQDSKEE